MKLVKNANHFLQRDIPTTFKKLLLELGSEDLQQIIGDNPDTGNFLKSNGVKFLPAPKNFASTGQNKASSSSKTNANLNSEIIPCVKWMIFLTPTIIDKSCRLVSKDWMLQKCFSGNQLDINGMSKLNSSKDSGGKNSLWSGVSVEGACSISLKLLENITDMVFTQDSLFKPGFISKYVSAAPKGMGKPITVIIDIGITLGRAIKNSALFTQNLLGFVEINSEEHEPEIPADSRNCLEIEEDDLLDTHKEAERH